MEYFITEEKDSVLKHTALSNFIVYLSAQLLHCFGLNQAFPMLIQP